MKMPWSFLRRRRAADLPPNEIADVKEAFGTDHESAEPVDQQPVSDPSRVAPADPEANFEEAAGQTVPAAGDREEAEPSVAQTADIRISPPAIKSGSRRRRLREQRGSASAPSLDSVVALPKADAQKSSVSEPTSSDGFVANAFHLDREINTLRRELAKKLRLQNAQLREMLQRFDPS
jgi:hypothetical protein